MLLVNNIDDIHHDSQGFTIGPFSRVALMMSPS
jgi:hypothetical protein